MRIVCERELKCQPKRVYLQLTAERFRADMHQIEESQQSAPWLLQPVHQWIARNLASNARGMLPTRHGIVERLRAYVNQPSRCGSYCELYPAEFEQLRDPGAWFQRVGCVDYRLVELGFNEQRALCKIGLVCRLRTAARDAHVFLCVGMDRGLKTCYVTPQFKHRVRYHCTNENPIVSIPNLAKFLSV